MGSIQLLPDLVIDQIAAGEVVENPSSVVKELIDNALDAKATQIKIELKQGGLALIRVTDNGVGMDVEDAKLCIKRHATSKIKETKDLLHNDCLGFRGEALASISAISKFSIITATKDQPGVKIKAEKGVISSVDFQARSHGTTVEVMHLFYNTPARKEFQKAPSRNTADVVKTVQNFSLCFSNVKFELFSEGKLLLQFHAIPQGNREGITKRMHAFFGGAFLDQAKWIEQKQDSYEIQGLVGLPSVAKKNRLGQHVFINQRCIFSSFISNVVKDIYFTRLKEEEFPVFILFLNIPLSKVDINVHPQKKQVRFLDKEGLKDFLEKAIKKTFQPKTFVAFDEKQFQKPSQELSLPSFFPKTEYLEEQQKSFIFHSNKTIKIIKKLNSYALVETNFLQDCEEESFVLFDLNACLARLIFEFFYSQQRDKTPLQSLLFPLIIELDLQQFYYLTSYLEEVKSLRLDFEILESKKILFKNIPFFFTEESFKESFLLFLDHLIEGHSMDIVKQKRKKHFAKLAKNEAMKKNIWSINEAQEVLGHLCQLETYALCPEGKATYIHLKNEDMKKLFSKKRFA